MIEQTIVNFEIKPYWSRVIACLKKNYRLLKFIGIVIITVPSTIHISFPFGSLVAFMLMVLLFFIPILFYECKIYIYSIRRIDDEVEFKYLSFNSDKVLVVKADKLRVFELKKDLFSLTVNKIGIYLRLNRTDVKNLLDQYRILSWTNEEYLDKLIQEFRSK